MRDMVYVLLLGMAVAGSAYLVGSVAERFSK
jgi:hypothetical protein